MGRGGIFGDEVETCTSKRPHARCRILINLLVCFARSCFKSVKLSHSLKAERKPGREAVTALSIARLAATLSSRDVFATTPDARLINTCGHVAVLLSITTHVFLFSEKTPNATRPTFWRG